MACSHRILHIWIDGVWLSGTILNSPNTATYANTQHRFENIPFSRVIFTSNRIRRCAYTRSNDICSRPKPKHSPMHICCDMEHILKLLKCSANRRVKFRWRWPNVGWRFLLLCAERFFPSSLALACQPFRSPKWICSHIQITEQQLYGSKCASGQRHERERETGGGSARGKKQFSVYGILNLSFLIVCFST